MVKRYPKNTIGRDYVVGDIHGCFSKLQTCLDEIEFDTEKDRLFCVGDLVDRGPESASFMKWLEYPWFHTVRGNHEDLLMKHYEKDYDGYHIHVGNGGRWFEHCTESLKEKMYNACKQLPYIIEVETDNGLVGILHADTGNEDDWGQVKLRLDNGDKNMKETLLWSRMRVRSNNFRYINGISVVYVGHTPMQCEMTLGNVVYIDTGAVFDIGHFTIKRLN